MKAMERQGEEILKNDTKFRSIDGWEKSKINGSASGYSNKICDVVFRMEIENKSYVAWINIFSKKVLTIKEIKKENNINYNYIKGHTIYNEGNKELVNITMEDDGDKELVNITMEDDGDKELVNITMEDDGVKEIIGKNTYTLSGYGNSCMDGYVFGTLTLNVGGFYDIRGKTYTIFIDVSDKKVLSIVKH